MKIAIIHYSTYGHITTLAKSVQQGAEKTGAKVDLFRVPETLSEDVLKLIHAPEKPKEIPIATNDVLSEYDAFIFGIPTRFGNVPAQFSAFLDATGSLWAKGALYGKPGTFFVSTGTSGGGQESTIRFALNYLTHHGMPYIPLGYAPFGQLSNLEEVHGGSPYGAGTFSGADGSRQPSDLELEVATIQGETFAKQAAKFVKTEADSTSGGGAATGGAAAGGAVAGGAAAAATAGGAAAAGKGNNGAANVEKKVEKTGKDDAATTGKDNKAADVEKKVEKKAETTGKDATARAQQSTPAAKDEASKSGCSKCIIM